MQKVLNIRSLLTIALASVVLLLPQGAHADNLPADTAYSDSINTIYSNGFVPASNTVVKLAALPAGSQPRTSTKYKTWAKQVNDAYAKLGSFIPKLLALTAGPSYSKSDPLLRKYLNDYKSFIAAITVSNLKAKVTSTETSLLTKKANALGPEGNSWTAQYAIDFGAANVKAPVSAPTISFTTAATVPGSLYATLSDNSSFSAQALSVTSYVIEWYVGSASATPITSTGTIVDNGYTKPVTFELTGVVSGGTYLARVAAVNSVGQGAWSQFFSATLP